MTIRTSALTGTEAVFAAHPENAAVKALAAIATDAKYDRAELTITVARENIVAGLSSRHSRPATTSSKMSPP